MEVEQNARVVGAVVGEAEVLHSVGGAIDSDNHRTSRRDCDGKTTASGKVAAAHPKNIASRIAARQSNSPVLHRRGAVGGKVAQAGRQGTKVHLCLPKVEGQSGYGLLDGAADRGIGIGIRGAVNDPGATCPLNGSVLIEGNRGFAAHTAIHGGTVQFDRSTHDGGAVDRAVGGFQLSANDEVDIGSRRKPLRDRIRRYREVTTNGNPSLAVRPALGSVPEHKQVVIVGNAEVRRGRRGRVRRRGKGGGSQQPKEQKRTGTTPLEYRRVATAGGKKPEGKTKKACQVCDNLRVLRCGSSGKRLLRGSRKNNPSEQALF